MHHMASMIDDHAAVLAQRLVAFLLVGAPRLPALLAVDDQNGAFNALKELPRLCDIEGLRRGGAMQRIKFPQPFAALVLFHPGARQRQRERRVDARIALPQLASAGFDAGVFAKMTAAAFVHLIDPRFHSGRRIGKTHTDGANAFDQHEFFTRSGNVPAYWNEIVPPMEWPINLN